ncbi:MAG: methyl-accepting chemotaxis protein [Sphingomonas fennica]
MTDGLDRLRARGTTALVLFSWAWFAAMMAVALFGGRGDAGVVLLLGLAVNAVPTMIAIRHRYDRMARLAVGTLAAANPALLVYLARGTVWQMDMHMYFFVALAALTVLCDWRPILLASVLIAVHHVALAMVAPDWVFVGTGDLARIGVHGAAVFLQFGILAYISGSLRGLLVRQQSAQAASERLTSEAVAARAEAETATAAARAAQGEAERALAEAARARDHAAEERARREAGENRAAARRDQELRSIAEEFERSVNGIVTAVGSAAEQLDRSAVALSEMAIESSRQSNAAAGSASGASQAAQVVAGSIASLSRSIGQIAASVDTQADLGQTAQQTSSIGDEAVRALAERTTGIGEFTTRIQAIASRTNLLALNAAIEAAHAGAAGRGFAVVAGEVKTLAAQASAATAEIGELVAGIHAGAHVAEGSLRDVAGAVEDLSAASRAISASVAQQRATAELIERSAQASAAGADEIAIRMERVADVANRTGDLSAEVSAAAADLLGNAGALKAAARSFVVRLNAA